MAKRIRHTGDPTRLDPPPFAPRVRAVAIGDQCGIVGGDRAASVEVGAECHECCGPIEDCNCRSLLTTERYIGCWNYINHALGGRRCIADAGTGCNPTEVNWYRDWCDDPNVTCENPLVRCQKMNPGTNQNRVITTMDAQTPVGSFHFDAACLWADYQSVPHNPGGEAENDSSVGEFLAIGASLTPDLTEAVNVVIQCTAGLTGGRLTFATVPLLAAGYGFVDPQCPPFCGGGHVDFRNYVEIWRGNVRFEQVGGYCFAAGDTLVARETDNFEFCPCDGDEDTPGAGWPFFNVVSSDRMARPFANHNLTPRITWALGEEIPLETTQMQPDVCGQPEGC